MVASSQKIAKQKTVKLAVIGAGAIGQKHAAIAASLPECKLVGICDANSSVQSLSKQLGTKFYADYEEIIAAEAPDGVIIATPTELHTPVGVACARRGVHLFVEKPIASDLPDGRKLVESARESGVRLLVGHHRRFNPLVEVTRRAIGQGKIGKLVAVSVLWVILKPADYFQVDWRRQPGGGPVLINMIHEIDNMRYICGEIKRVCAETSSAVRRFEVEDTAGVSLRFLNGALGTIIVSDCVPSCWSYEATTGENPYYFRTHENCYLFFGTQGSLAFPQLRVVRYANPQQAGWQYPLETEQLAVEPRDPLVTQLKHFCRVITGQEEPRTSGEDALRTLAVVRAVLKSAKSGQPVELSG